MPNQDNRFALLIDAENVSGKYIKRILDELSNEGVITYKRIYGDWTSKGMNSWKDILLDHSITPIQQYSYTTGKNATDSAMIIDAMDILYAGNVEGFCLVSSDSDFTRLASRLREAGKIVVGMGEKKTPSPFIAACNKFKYLEVLQQEGEEEAAAECQERKCAEKSEGAAPSTAQTSLREIRHRRQQRGRRPVGAPEHGGQHPHQAVPGIRRAQLRPPQADQLCQIAGCL